MNILHCIIYSVINFTGSSLDDCKVYIRVYSKEEKNISVEIE